MSIDKLKTKFFTGAWLTDVKHYFSKINEIIDYLNNNPITAVNYKVYRALLTQTGASAPTAVILENTLGADVIYTYDSAGYYIATCTGVFTQGKTMVRFGSEMPVDALFECQSNFPNSFGIFVTSDWGATGVNDALLDTSIEIIVYN